MIDLPRQFDNVKGRSDTPLVPLIHGRFDNLLHPVVGNHPLHLPKECAFDKAIRVFYTRRLRGDHQYFVLGHEEEVQHIEGIPGSQIQYDIAGIQGIHVPDQLPLLRILWICRIEKVLGADDQSQVWDIRVHDDIPNSLNLLVDKIG